MTRIVLMLIAVLLIGVGCPKTETLEVVSTQEYWQSPSTTITLHVPRLHVPDKPSATEKFNQHIDLLIKDYVTSFKQAQAQVDRSRVPASEYLNFIEVSTYIRTLNSKLVSIELINDTFFAGTAHPNRSTRSINYDLEQEKVLQLEDLLVFDTSALETLATTTIATIMAQSAKKGEAYLFDEQWLQGGAGPDIRNYHTVSLGSEGFFITFDPYDIAPYAVGSTSVLIPFDQLETVVAPRVKELLN